MEITEKYNAIRPLMVKSMQGTLNFDEYETLRSWASESENNKKLYDRITNKHNWEKIARTELKNHRRKVAKTFFDLRILFKKIVSLLKCEI